MSDLLTRRLHEGMESLPVRTTAAAALRGRAVSRRRQQVAATAVTAAVGIAAVLGAEALLGGGGTPNPAPPASPTATAAESLGLDRFLLPDDLPATEPFAAWLERHETRDMVGGPVCSSMVNGNPDRSVLVEFTGRLTGQRAYQSVAYYPTVQAAEAALLQHRQEAQACINRLGGTSDEGFVIPKQSRNGAASTIEAYARVGRYVSYLHVTSAIEGVIHQDRAADLLEILRDRLDGTSPPPVPTTDPVTNALAAALLDGGVSGGSATYDDVSVSGAEPGLLPQVGHPCAVADPAASTLSRTFTIAPGLLAVQRIVLTSSEDEARRLRRSLTPGCPADALIVERADGVEETRLSYDAAVEVDRRATVHVALLRVGMVVTEIAIVDRVADGVDHAAQLPRLVEAAITRIRATLLVGSAESDVTTIPTGFEFADTDAETERRLGTFTTGRYEGTDRPWMLGPCSTPEIASDRRRTDFLQVVRTGLEDVSTLQLAVYSDAATATQTLSAIRHAVTGCDGGSPDPSLRWSTQELRGVVGDTWLAVGRWEAGGEPTGSGVYIAAAQVYNVLFVRVDSGRTTPAADLGDRGAQAAITSAQANTSRICSYFGPCR